MNKDKHCLLIYIYILSQIMFSFHLQQFFSGILRTELKIDKKIAKKLCLIFSKSIDVTNFLFSSMEKIMKITPGICGYLF